MGADVRWLGEMFRRFFTRRVAQRVELVACRPLHAGGMLYAADLDGRRHVFVTTPNAACLIASYAIERGQMAVGEDLCRTTSKNDAVCAKGSRHEP
jgi:hypothetical protein